MREELYSTRWEKTPNEVEGGEFRQSHKLYRETLKESYSRVLKFEATCVCYCSKNGFLRLGRDVVKWDKWDSLLEEVQTQDIAFREVYGLFKDAQAEENFEAEMKLQRESLDVTSFISGNVAGLRQAIELMRRDDQREKLLGWLCCVDPSKNYNAAIEKHQTGTGDWLIQRNGKFKEWKNRPNSLLWLNGKGSSFSFFNYNLTL